MPVKSSQVIGLPANVIRRLRAQDWQFLEFFDENDRKNLTLQRSCCRDGPDLNIDVDERVRERCNCLSGVVWILPRRHVPLRQAWRISVVVDPDNDDAAVPAVRHSEGRLDPLDGGWSGSVTCVLELDPRGLPGSDQIN